MKVSLNWIKKYIDLPKDKTPKDIAYDLTLRTVEVESIEDTSLKYDKIIVGKILEVKKHPNADTLRICITDIGRENPVQIVCGGSNLYEGELVVVCLPGAKVYWHGEGELVEIKETKMRGESSYGMICASSEVFLDSFFPAKDESEIVDLTNIDCHVGDKISDIVCMNDTVLEIDNKSLTNRPDLWGHYGIARELSAIYDTPLKPLPKLEIDKSLPKYDIKVEDESKCKRYVGVEISNVYVKESPMWLKAALINGGMRPINTLVDITNYVMLAVGQPTHAFDSTHVSGNKIIVRNAYKDEELLLLDNTKVILTEDDLIISDEEGPLALAGIRGGKKDSILDTTTSVVLEVANFTASTIRKSGKRFEEKTDAGIRYEKNLDTEKVTEGLNLALSLFKELYPDSKIVAYGEEYPSATERAKIDVSKEFLNVRLGKEIPEETVTKVLKNLGYDVTVSDGVYHTIAPIWRSTGDVSIKDDVMGDIARLLSFESFEAKPLTIKFEHAVHQDNVLLERRIREYLANRCGFNEIFTYPWIDIKYINAIGIDTSKCVSLATPPAPELKVLRSSLIPGMLEAISKNLRYFNEFKMFEMTEVYEKGEYHESTEEETLPIHKKYLTGALVGKDAKELFYIAKGVIENIGKYTHMESLGFIHEEKPSWADKNAYLNITLNNEKIGELGLLSVKVMNEAKIKRVNVAIFEINSSKFIPFPSRTNTYKSLPILPLVEKDLSIIVDESITWESISKYIKSKVSELIFVEEYKGEKIPIGKKSITLKVKLKSEDKTLTMEEINKVMESLVKTLNKMCGAILREE